MLIGFIIGLSSTLHCLGMCGPIAIAIPINRSSNLNIIFGALQYNIGRILAYSLLGVIIGSIGLSIASLQWMQSLSIITGILMILIAWHRFFSFGSFGIAGNITRSISSGIGKIIRSKSPLKLLGLGVLNGFLPCGIVFIGLTNSLLQGSPIGGGLAMFAFGLGTVPILLSVVFFASKLSGNWRLKFSKSVPYLMTLIGIFVILRGLNLGVPFISPEIKLSKQSANMETVQNQKIEMTCCASTSKYEKCTDSSEVKNIY